MNGFTFYTLFCLFNIAIGLIIKYKTELVLDKEKISYKPFKEMLDSNRQQNDFISNLSYTYFDDFFDLILASCIPVVDIFTCYTLLKVSFSHKSHLIHSLELMDLVDLEKKLNYLNKLKEYDDSKFYDDLSKLLKDGSFEYKDIIIKSLNMLIGYIKEYENIKLLSKQDIEYKKELSVKLNESILKFKEMSKKLITLHNKNNYNLNDLDNFNSLLDNIIDDIDNEKAIFIKQKDLD